LETTQIKDYSRETTLARQRLSIASGVVLVMFIGLFFRVWFLQVYEYQRFETLSNDNRIRLQSIAPARGEILDRNGRLLAENKLIYLVEILPSQVDDMGALLNQIARLIHLDEISVERFMAQVKSRPSFEPQTLKLALNESEVARYAVHQHKLDGASLKVQVVRDYPYGEETAHVVGYVGRISQDDLAVIDREAYRGIRYIGRLGIEEMYEEHLRGQIGYEQVETSAHGRSVRVLERQGPINGEDLILGLDIELQIAAREALGDYRGSIVALDPASGDVLAFVSNPVYDPNLFVNGISQEKYGKLRDNLDRPLLNRALNGRYAPGSTIKGLVGLAALERGFSPAHTEICPGWYSLPGSSHRYRCWRHDGHGEVNLNTAIAQSCDVYFYSVANQLGIDYLHDFLTEFGLGRRTGIDLQNEPTGLVPSKEWKERARGEIWHPGETVITGIGQGFMLATPIQLAVMAATLANNGTRMAPRLVTAVRGVGYETFKELPILIKQQVNVSNPNAMVLISEAMQEVMHGERGTARAVGADAMYRMAGKSGTSQVIGIAQNEKYDADKIAERLRDHAIFVAYAPVENPKIALVVIVENGGSGSGTAAPIARALMDQYLLKDINENTESEADKRLAIAR
jgi:penicillin-binding protein 2